MLRELGAVRALGTAQRRSYEVGAGTRGLRHAPGALAISSLLGDELTA